MSDPKQEVGEEQKPVEEVILPDEQEQVSDVDKIKAEYEAKIKETSDRLKAFEAEKAELAKAADAAKKRMYQALEERKPKADSAPPKVKTFEEYEAEVVGMYEEDPKAGIKKILRDVALDREIERQEYERRLKEVEDAAYRRAIRLDPERARMVDEAEKLAVERPDLANLTFDQRMEFVSLRSRTASQQAGSNAQDAILADRNVASDFGGGRSVGRGTSKTPAWLNDPTVQREAARSGFRSKQDVLNWADPRKAAELSRARSAAK